MYVPAPANTRRVCPRTTNVGLPPLSHRRPPLMADVPHLPPADERSSYYLDQLFMIGVCGALAAVTILLWQSGSLATLLDAKFALAVGAGGLCLLGLVILRGVAVWTSVDTPPANGKGHAHGPDCDHSHGHGNEGGGHSHSHGHDAPKPAEQI